MTQTQTEAKPQPAKAADKTQSKPQPAKAADKTQSKPQPAKALSAADKKAAAAKEAAKEAERLAKEAAKERERLEKEKEKEKALKVAEATLARDAKEINVRFEKADKYLQQADDHRLSAALKLAEADELCRANGIKFKEWCEENINQSYETARKLLPVGKAEAEEEGKGAVLLEDMRSKNKAANKAARDKKKKAAADVPADKTKREAAPAERALAAAEAMPKEQRTNFVKSQAEALGLHTVTEEQHKILQAAGSGANVTPRDMAERAFERMGAKAQIAFAAWCAEQVGAEFYMPTVEDNGNDNEEPDIPEGLRRSKN